MNNAAKLFTTVGIALVMTASQSKAEDQWFVYCEGVENGQNTAYLTTALYQHYESATHKAELEEAAMHHLAETRGAPAYGCSGVNFMSKASALQARDRTADVHKLVGNNVVMFEMDAPKTTQTAEAPKLKRTRLSRGRLDQVNTTFGAGPDGR
jgi:hypothetical protein